MGRKNWHHTHTHLLNNNDQYIIHLPHLLNNIGTIISFITYQRNLKVLISNHTKNIFVMKTKVIVY